VSGRNGSQNFTQNFSPLQINGSGSVFKLLPPLEGFTRDVILNFLIEPFKELIDATVKEDDGTDNETRVQLAAAIFHSGYLAPAQVADDTGHVTLSETISPASRFDTQWHTLMRHMFVLRGGAYVDRRVFIVAEETFWPQPLLWVRVATCVET
jgi:hypothetical protein